MTSSRPIFCSDVVCATPTTNRCSWPISASPVAAETVTRSVLPDGSGECGLRGSGRCAVSRWTHARTSTRSAVRCFDC